MARIQDHGVVTLLHGHAPFGRQVSRGFHVGDDRLSQQAAAGGVQRMSGQIWPVLSKAEHVERGRRLECRQGKPKVGRHRTTQTADVPTNVLWHRRKFTQPRGCLRDVLGGNHQQFALLWVRIDDAPRHARHHEACNPSVVFLAAVVQGQDEGFVHRTDGSSRHGVTNTVGVLVWNHGKVVADPRPRSPGRAVPSLGVPLGHGRLQREHVIGKFLIRRVPLRPLGHGMAFLLQHLDGFGPHGSRPAPPWHLGGVLNDANQPTVFEHPQHVEGVLLAPIWKLRCIRQHGGGLMQGDRFVGMGHQHELVRGDAPWACAPGDRFDGGLHGPTRGHRRFAQLVHVPHQQVTAPEATQAVIGASHALQHAVHGAWGIDLNHALNAADVNAQLKARGAHQGIEVTRTEVVLHRLPRVLRQTAVMHPNAQVRRHRLQALSDGFSVGTAVHEHQGLWCLLDLSDEAPEGGMRTRGQRVFHRANLVFRFRLLGFHGQFRLTGSHGDHRFSTPWSEPFGHVGWISNGCGEPDALHAPTAQMIQP